ncbi:hypothetical protein IWW48_004721 [Coemansia sp. RSA 1200]|nr:hypothetical protein IWW48_004721 [Coemansia sp. RSA 1200]
MTSHAGSMSNKMKPTNEMDAERLKEAVEQVSEYVHEDKDGVLLLAQPRQETTQQLSANIVGFILATIAILDKEDSIAAESTGRLLFEFQQQTSRRQVTRMQARKEAAEIHGVSDFVQKTQSLHSEFRSWIPTVGISGTAKRERDIYQRINNLIMFVAQCIEFYHLSLNTPDSDSFPSDGCLIYPYSQQDIKPKGGDDGSRIDIGLVTAPIKPGMKTELKEPSVEYEDIFAIAEVKLKSSTSDVNNAFAQLLRYTRNIYKWQVNRRFAWGLTVCGADIRACHFSNDAVFASAPMSLLKSQGLRQFVTLLVDWSLCSNDQRGYDPDFHKFEKGGSWYVRIPGLDGQEATTYKIVTQMVASDRLFGRHTRCFKAVECLPSDATGNDSTNSTDNSNNNNYGPPVVIKDAWAYSKEDLKDDTRDEVGFLQTISKELSKHTSDVVYPELLGGGRVSLEYSDTGTTVGDTTASILGDLYNSESTDGKVPISFREHKRLVMSPVGEPLKTAKSFDELMAVLADAMLCHDAVWRHCGILHRDISDNNTLVVRQGDQVRGLLIDFNNAITTREQSATRPGRTGTFPLMSINNLENEGVPRTALDD